MHTGDYLNAVECGKTEAETEPRKSNQQERAKKETAAFANQMLLSDQGNEEKGNNESHHADGGHFRGYCYQGNKQRGDDCATGHNPEDQVADIDTLLFLRFVCRAKTGARFRII